jgi:hypothetical protein
MARTPVDVRATITGCGASRWHQKPRAITDLRTHRSSGSNLGLIRFGGRVDYVDRVSSSFIEESLQAFGGVEISICRSLVAAAERPGVI